MLKVVERESLIASEGEDDNLVERPLCSVPGALQQNSKKRWRKIRDALKLAKVRVVLSNALLSSVSRGKSKQSSNAVDDIHSATSSKRQHNGNEWTEAFDELIRSPEGRRQFTKFLRSEYSEENIVFWWAVEELHEIGRNGGELVNAVQDIYNTFVAADSSLAINIDHDTRADITERIEHQDKANYTEDVFDKAQSHVYRLMEKDCFSRFVCTDTYKKLSKQLKLPEILQAGISM